MLIDIELGLLVLFRYYFGRVDGFRLAFGVGVKILFLDSREVWGYFLSFFGFLFIFFVVFGLFVFFLCFGRSDSIC